MTVHKIPDAVARKYTMTRIASGDYVLPSNDAQTIWRIARYVDGPSSGLEHMARDREFWGVWKWAEPVTEGSCVDTGSWDRWEFCEGLLKTRADAATAALKAS